MFAEFSRLNQEGSFDIAQWILNKIENCSFEKAKEIVKDLQHLKPEMGIISWIYSLLEKEVDITHIKKELEASLKNTIKNALEILNFEATITTISNSYTLFEFFKNIEKKLRIYILKSEPGGEGVVFAEKIRASTLHEVMLVNDSEMHIVVEKSDYILIGADSVLENGNIINKVGSKLLAIVANYYKKPFFVLADRTKFFEAKPKNSIFEIVPNGLITGIITS
ncbi:initiation factor 2B [Thermosipho ferrireducens]|uniref:Initiation factor 2B n=1 Tax=Thermosipho ferrireducens TaxID=2571116 RepID=A0ABX7SBF1_9BACT|nr:initiation factor 2B [Thermosipho ferrireducens]